MRKNGGICKAICNITNSPIKMYKYSHFNRFKMELSSRLRLLICQYNNLFNHLGVADTKSDCNVTGNYQYSSENGVFN